MEKIKAFRNAREFNELFGIQEHGNGVKSRRNKILLEFYKCPSIWNYCRKKGYRRGYNRYFSITSMADLKTFLEYDIQRELENNARFSTEKYYPVYLMGNCFWSKTFSTDESDGIPSNGAVGFVRYVTHEPKREGKVYRMRAGKFYKRLILESELGRSLPEQVLNWLCEEFAAHWSSYVTRQLPNYTLHVDDNFKRIYSYGFINEGMYACTSDFNSCMMDDDQYIFYQQSVKAKAAYLTNENNRVIARCVIFTDVYDECGKKWRLAERQYAEGQRDLYKRCLVDALIDGGYIDAYKQVGVDCHHTTSYVDIEGKSLSNKEFHIECNLNFSVDCDDAWDYKEDCRILSYQDSFKFYNYKEKIAYNTPPRDYKNIVELDTTNCYLEGAWDEYHKEWCSRVLWVWVGYEQLRCNSNDLDDFIRYESEFVHKDYLVKCPVCGELMPDPKYYENKGFLIFSQDGNKRTYVCSHDCRRELDAKIKERSFYDVIESKYYDKRKEKPLKFLHLFAGNVEILTMSASNFQKYISTRRVTIVEYGNVGIKVPMYCSGIQNPQERFDLYVRQSPLSMTESINQLVFENDLNSVSELYNK